MPEVLGSPPSPRTALFWNGTAWQWALVDAAGRLQIDVVDAAGLQDALQSVATDRLIVRGEDQLFSFAAPLQSARAAALSGADGYVDSHPVTAGHVWHITRIVCTDYDSATTAHQHVPDHDGLGQLLGIETAAFAAGDHSYHDCDIWLDAADYVRVNFIGGLLGDNCTVRLFGFSMTQE